MQTVSLSTSPSLWQAVLSTCPSVPVDYTPSMISYQQAYFGYTDLSCTFTQGDKPIAVFTYSDNLTSNGGGILPPLCVPSVIGTSLHRKLIRECLVLTSHSPSAAVSFRSYCVDDWHLELMAQGGRIEAVQHDLWVDLSLPLGEIKSCFRKQYRNSINQGAKLFECETVHRFSGGNPDLAIDKLRDLHIEVSGRQTRAQDTWDAQKQGMRSGDDFIVFVRYQGEIVGASLFSTSKSHASYSVGAYRRELFSEMPVSHTAIWEAITHSKSIGRRWLYLGRRAYPQDPDSPTEKEVSIGYFKRGFATDITPQFNIILGVE